MTKRKPHSETAWAVIRDGRFTDLYENPRTYSSRDHAKVWSCSADRVVRVSITELPARKRKTK